MNERGYSLMEMTMALAISATLMSSLMFSLNYVQILSHDFSLRSDRDGNLWIAPLLLIEWVAAAGNNRWGHPWVGVKVDGGSACFKSDIDGQGGFPDNDLSESYEDIALEQRSESLAIRSGAGSFQPVIRNIVTFESERRKDDLMILRWSGRTDQKLRTTGAEEPDSVEMNIHLSNYCVSLFSREDN